MGTIIVDQFHLQVLGTKQCRIYCLQKESTGGNIVWQLRATFTRQATEV